MSDGFNLVHIDTAYPILFYFSHVSILEAVSGETKLELFYALEGSRLETVLRYALVFNSALGPTQPPM
jgi:hypothetical protein